MRNLLLVALIIIATIFPFAATAVELTEDRDALIALAGLSVVAAAITVGAMLYRPKRSSDTDTPVQSIPTVKSTNPRQQGAAKTNPTAEAKPAVKPGAQGNPTTNKSETKRQRAR